MEKNNILKNDYIEGEYPFIPDRLIECLKADFPNVLPRKFIDAYELGILVGQQQVIDKLVTEKFFEEQNDNRQ